MRMDGIRMLVGAGCLLLGVGVQAIAGEPTSETHERLKQLLVERPQADTNRDGVLTMSEVRQFRERLQQRVRAAAGAVDTFYAAHPPDRADLKYGQHERQVLDFWQAEGEGPRPLVVYIHGGGWIGGDKRKITPVEVERLLEAGVSVASISYRYSTMAPYPAPLRDGGLAVQYLRHHAKALNLDPARVACYGRSAGATTSLWLAFRDDMADPDAGDPVLRQSTRLTCAGAVAAPTTLDKPTMDAWFGMKVAAHPALFPLLGVETEAALYDEATRRLAAEASPVNHLTAEDPPVLLDYQGRDVVLQAEHTANQAVHHALFGKKLKALADEVGVEAVLVTERVPQAEQEDLIDFLIRKLR